MKRTSLLLLAVLAAACTRPEATVSFTQVCLPPEAGSCLFPSACDAQYIGTYTLDLDQSSRLWLVIELRNQHPNNTDLTVGQVNTGDAFIEEIEVSYDSPVAIAGISYRVQSNVPANGSSVTSVFPFDGIAAATIPLGASVPVVAKVKAKGKFGDGGSFETAEFDIPVRLCRGCVPALPACAATAPTRITCPPNSAGQVPISVACQ